MITYALSAFDKVQSVKKIVTDKLSFDTLPSINQAKALEKWTPELLDKFDKDAKFFERRPDGTKEDRSGAMAELAYIGTELGWADEHIAAMLYDADDRWGKYKTRNDRNRRIIDFVNRARAKHGYNAVENIDLTNLIASANQTAVQMGENKLVYGFRDFVDAEFKIEWTLDQLLAQGGFGLVTGFPGTGKTQFCIAIGAHLALGSPKFLKWDNIGGRKKVMFLSLEMGAAPLNHFMGLIGQGYENKETLNRNFLVAPFGTPMPLDMPEGQAFLDRLMQDHMPDVVIIDSLQKISSRELTDEQAVKSLVHYLSVVRSKYGCSMLVVHHNRKKPNDGQKKGVELSDVYGSTYITTDVDFVLSLRTEQTDMLQVDTLKNRLGKVTDPFFITRDAHLGFHTDLESIRQQFGGANGAPGI